MLLITWPCRSMFGWLLSDFVVALDPTVVAPSLFFYYANVWYLDTDGPFYYVYKIPLVPVAPKSVEKAASFAFLIYFLPSPKFNYYEALWIFGIFGSIWFARSIDLSLFLNEVRKVEGTYSCSRRLSCCCCSEVILCIFKFLAAGKMPPSFCL